MNKFLNNRKLNLMWFYRNVLSQKPINLVTNLVAQIIIPKILKLEEGVLVLNKKDPAVSGGLTLGIYEQFETRLFRQAIRSGMIIIDVGANIGYYTVIAGRRVGIKGKVIAYEPAPINFSFLEKNIELNKLGNVFAFPCAIAEKIGRANLYLSPSNKGAHSLSRNQREMSTIVVETETLDHALKQQNIARVDLIKMDIEGAEILAIDGMNEIIKRSPNLIMFSEFYPAAMRRLKREPLDFLRRLNHLGFRLSLIDEANGILENLPPESFETFVKEFLGETTVNIYAEKTKQTSTSSWQR